MAVLVVDGAVLTCSFGAAPSTLSASPSPAGGTNAGAATIMDFAPMVNIKPFGLCSSPANPAVNTPPFTPKPCIPATASPWVPGSPAVTIGGQPALDSACTCNCLWAGVISVISPGQQAAQV